MHKRAAEAIRHLYPQASRANHEIQDDGKGPFVVRWDLPGKPPTDDQIEAALIEVDKLAYRAERAAEYPPITDQLDALWMGGKAADAMRATIMAIKAKYPKDT